MKKDTLQLHINADLDVIACGRTTKRILELVAIPPKKIIETTRPPLNLAVVLDRSGSMSGNKINYVKQAASHMLDLLEEQDRLTLVVYDDRVDLLSPSIPITPTNRRELQNRISTIRTGSMTNLEGGWIAGCEEVARNCLEKTINRTLLLTDGLANVGESNLEVLSRHARGLAERGISTSTFGVGDDFNGHLLEAMANQGDGNYYFISSPERAQEFFLHEFKQLDTVTVHDSELILDLPADVNANVVATWKNWRTKSHLHIALGSLYSEQDVHIYIELETPANVDVAEQKIEARLFGKGVSDQLLEDNTQVTFKVVDPAKMDAVAPKRDVKERYALVKLSDVANEALQLEYMHHNEQAYLLLSEAIKKYQEYINPKQLLEYLDMAERMKHGMDEFDRKSSQYRMYATRQSKPTQPK